MAITVADIEQKEFAFKGAGYDPYDVDQYLDQICDEMVAMQDRIDALEKDLTLAKQAAENVRVAVAPAMQPLAQPSGNEAQALRERIGALEKALEEAQQEADDAKRAAKADAAPMGKTTEMVESILLNAQKVGDEAIADAKKRAEALLGEAEAKAKEATKDLTEQKDTLQKEISTLRSAAKDYKEKFVSLLKEQKNLLADDSLFPEE